VDLFQTLADPTRRHIVEVLRRRERAVSEIVDEMAIDQSGGSRHLRILSEAGFVRVRPDGQKRLYSLPAEPFRELDAWLGRYRDLWEKRLDNFARALDERAARRKGPAK